MSRGFSHGVGDREMSTASLEKSHDRAASYSVKLAAAAYHQRGELSNSGNNILIDQSPAHYLYNKQNPSDPTPAMRLGTITHSAILEPDLFLDTHVAMPECDRRTKAGKELYEEFHIKHAGKVVMDNKSYHRTFGMVGAVMAHPKARAILHQSRNELSFFSELGGVKVKCRPDILRAGLLAGDLKKTTDASFRAFQKAVATYKMHRQAAFYLDILTQITGEKYDTFVHISVEEDPPHAVGLYALDEASIDKGREEIHRGLRIYRECSLSGKWPSYSDDVVPMNLPSYAW